MTYADHSLIMTVMIIQNMFLLYFVYASNKVNIKTIVNINVSTSSRVYTKSLFMFMLYPCNKERRVIKKYISQKLRQSINEFSPVSQSLSLNLYTKSYGGIVHKSHMINYNRS